MAKYSSTIEYNLSTKLDSKGIDNLRKKLNDVQTQLFKLQDGYKSFGQSLSSSSDKKSYVSTFEKDYETILKIQKALSSSTNFATGNLNTKQFSSELSKMNISAEQLVSTFKSAGTVGQQAFNSLAASLASTETRVSKMSTTVAKMFNTFQNTLRWGVTASIFETASNSIGRAVEYVKDLDKSLNDIRIVSGYSSEEMTKFADSANKVAQALGQTTTAYTNASLIYIQQGKTLKESNDLAELTLKTANVTGQATSEVSEQLTSLMNGYQIAVDDMEASVDKLAKVAAVGASDLEELATAESKVASTANALGVSQDQLVAQLSTIISVTRQAPENVGNAMKTIYARLGDLQLGETLEDGTSLGTIGKALDAVGINIQTTTGDLRDMGDVLEDLMGVWNNLDTGEKQALAIKLAGKYQYNNLMALLENSKMYNEQLEASENSLGTINQQQEIYLDSLEAKLNSMQSAFEGFINSIFNSDDIKPLIEDVTDLINLLTSFSSSVGSQGLLTGIVGTGVRTFSKNIGDQALNMYQNRASKRSIQNSNAAGVALLKEIGVNPSDFTKDSKTYQAAVSLGSRTSTMNSSQQTQAKQFVTQLAQAENELLQRRKASQELLTQIAAGYKAATGDAIELKLQEDGQVQNLDKALNSLKAIQKALQDMQKPVTELKAGTGMALANLASATDKIQYTKDGRITKASGRKFIASYKAQAQSLREQFEGSSIGSEIMSSDAFQEYRKALGQMSQYIDYLEKPSRRGNSRDVTAGVQAATEATSKALQNLIASMSNLTKKFPESAEEIKQFIGNIREMEQVTEGAAENVKELSKGLDLKMIVSEAAEVAGSFAQLYSVMQSVKSIGGIWADSDLDQGEKIGQIVENLLFSLPMLLSSVASLKTSFKNIKTGFANWNNGLLTAAGLSATTATATERLTVTARGLLGVLKSNGVGLLLTVIPAAIAYLSGKAEQEAENQKQEAQEVIDKYTELSDKAEQTATAQKKVEENYKVYKETGKLTDELKDSIQAYADTLDIPLAKQDLWNENIDKTINKLKEASVIQASGVAQASKDAADKYKTNFLADQISKNSRLEQSSASVAPAEDYFRQNQDFFKEVSPYLETLGVDTSDWDSVQQGMNLLYQVASGSIDFSTTAETLDASEQDLQNIFESIAKDTTGLLDRINGYENLYGSAYLSGDSLSSDSPATIKKTVEGMLGGEGSLSELNFGLNDKNQLEVVVKPDADFALAASQIQQFSNLSEKDILATAGVTNAEEGHDASAKYRYGEALRSAQTLSQDENLRGYLSSTLKATQNDLAVDLYQKQASGETITLDTITDLFNNSDAIKSLLAEGYSSSDLTSILTNLADLFNITLDEDAQKKITELSDDLSKASKNAADLQIQQTRAENRQKAIRYIGDNSRGLSGENYLDTYVLPTVSKFAGLSEDSFYDFLESNANRLTSGANFDNVLDYIKSQSASGADMDLVKQLLATEDGLINAINGNTNALDSQYDVLVYQQNLEQSAREQYKANQAWTGRSEEALDAAFDEAAQTIDEKINSGDYNLTDVQETSLLADAYSHIDEIIAGTYDWDAAIENVVTNLDELADAAQSTQTAFVTATPKIMAAVEAELKKSGKDYTEDDVKQGATEYGQNLVSLLGDEGAQAIFSGIASGNFSATGVQNWISSALEAGASKDMINEWLKEAVQDGVHIDINAEYNGELDDQINAAIAEQMKAQERASQWQGFLDQRTNEYAGQGYQGNSAINMAMSDVNSFETWLSEHGLTKADFDAMGISTVGKTLDEIEQEVLDIETGQAEKNKQEEDQKRRETSSLRAAQNRYMETKYGKGHVNQDELDESVDSVYDTLKKYNYSMDDLTRLGIDLNQDASDIISDFLDAIDKTGDSAEDATKSFNELSGSLDEFTGLSDALDSRDNIQELMTQADNVYTEEGRSYFTQDEAYDILKDNPDYIKYLDQVEDGWKLNERAVLEYEQAVLDAGKAMEELTGDAIDLSQQNQDIVTVMSLDSAYTSEDGSGYLDQILSLNHALEEGSIQTTQFLDQISTQFSEFFSSVSAQAINAGQSIKEFFDNNDDAANMAQIFSDEMYQGIKQLNTQYQAGKITVGQYAKSLATTTTNSIQLKAAQSGLTKSGNEWVKVTNHGTVALEDMDNESKQSVKELESMEKSFDRLSAAADFSDYITDNFDEMTQVFSETGSVLESAVNEMGGLKESFGPMIQGLAQQMVDFYKTDELALTATASQIAAATDMTQQQAAEMLSSVDSLASGMMNSSAVAGAAMQGTMTQTQSAINNIATGISLIIQGIMSEVASIDAEVNSETVQEGEDIKEITQTSDGKTTSVGTIRIPKFKIRLSGKGSSNGAAGKSGSSQSKVQNGNRGYKFDSVMSSEDAKAKGINLAADIGDDVAVAVYKDASGHYVGTKATDSQTGAWYLGNGVGQLFDSATLSDYSPYKGSGSNNGYTPKYNGTGGSGGSGGGSGSEYEPKSKDALEDEADRYEKVNAQIDKLNNALEQLNTEEARLVGFNRIDIIKEETANIKKQIEVYQEKLKLQKEERDEVKNDLGKYGITFDDEGYISNYQEKFKEYLDGINYLIDQYNAATTEEAQDALEEQIDSAQDAFDEFKDLIEQYDELNSNTIKETEKNIQDLHDKIEDMIIDLFNKAVDATDELKDMNDKWLDLQKALRPWSTEDDDPFLAAEISSKKIAGYLDADTDAANKFYDTMIKRYTELRDKAKTEQEKAGYQKLLDSAIAGKKAQGKGTLETTGSGYLDAVFNNAKIMDENMRQYEQTGKSDLFGEDQEALLEASQTVYEQAVNAVTGLREEIDSLRDDIIDCIDDVADKIEERSDLWSRVNDQLDHYMSLSQMIHGDSIKGYEEQEKVLELQIKANQTQLSEAKAEAEYWNNLKGTLKEGSKEWKEADSKAAEAITKQNELLQTSIETAQSLLQSQANKYLAQWEQQIFGTDMDWVQTQWEMANRNQDYYLDAVNKAYNIQKLQSQYNDLLDGAVSLDVQKKISDQMNQQLTYLREKTNLSAYDVSYAQAQLEILKQQIALEEAQANKSQMKLRRDSQGNYNYVYTADEGNVKDAEDSLLDAKNNAYNLAKDQMKQTQEDSFSAIQQAKQTILDIWTDTALTTEERAQRIQEVIDNLKEYLEMTGEQLSTSNMDIVNSFYDMVDSLNDENKGNLQTIYDDMKAGALDAFDTVDDRWSTTISNAIKNTDKFDQATTDLTNKMQESFEEYDKSIQQASANSGENLDDITSNLGAVGDAVDDLTSSFDSFTEGLKRNMEQIAGYANALAQYQEQYDKIANENSELLKTIESLKEERDSLLRQVQQGANEASGITSTTTSESGSSNGGNGDSGGNQGNGFNNSGYSESDLIAGIAQAIYNYGWDSGWGNNPVRSTKLTQAYGAEFAQKVQDYINRYFYDDSKLHYDPSANRFSSYNLIGYDTGGYTGDWSDGSGKLALLHSKEMVLNASDTENILKAVQSVRAMTEAMKGVSLAEAVGSISSIGKSIESQNGTVDQNVSITAEFPNATSADEIREAILGLNNQVLHYAHRRA